MWGVKEVERMPQMFLSLKHLQKVLVFVWCVEKHSSHVVKEMEVIFVCNPSDFMKVWGVKDHHLISSPHYKCQVDHHGPLRTLY